MSSFFQNEVDKKVFKTELKSVQDVIQDEMNTKVSKSELQNLRVCLRLKTSKSRFETCTNMYSTKEALDWKLN